MSTAHSFPTLPTITLYTQLCVEQHAFHLWHLQILTLLPRWWHSLRQTRSTFVVVRCINGQPVGYAWHPTRTGLVYLNSTVAVKLSSLNSRVSKVVEALPSASFFVDAGLHFSGLTGWARSSSLEWLDVFLFVDIGELILLKHVWCLNALWILITVGDLERAPLNENMSLCSSLLILCALTCGYEYLWGFLSLKWS